MLPFNKACFSPPCRPTRVLQQHVSAGAIRFSKKSSFYRGCRQWAPRGQWQQCSESGAPCGTGCPPASTERGSSSQTLHGQHTPEENSFLDKRRGFPSTAPSHPQLGTEPAGWRRQKNWAWWHMKATWEGQRRCFSAHAEHIQLQHEQPSITNIKHQAFSIHTRDFCLLE